MSLLEPLLDQTGADYFRPERCFDPIVRLHVVALHRSDVGRDQGLDAMAKATGGLPQRYTGLETGGGGRVAEVVDPDSGVKPGHCREITRSALALLTGRLGVWPVVGLTRVELVTSPLSAEGDQYRSVPGWPLSWGNESGPFVAVHR
jgi:hypothetical protein